MDSFGRLSLASLGGLQEGKVPLKAFRRMLFAVAHGMATLLGPR